jgi:hypothetical protein
MPLYGCERKGPTGCQRVPQRNVSHVLSGSRVQSIGMPCRWPNSVPVCDEMRRGVFLSASRLPAVRETSPVALIAGVNSLFRPLLRSIPSDLVGPVAPPEAFVKMDVPFMFPSCYAPTFGPIKIYLAGRFEFDTFFKHQIYSSRNTPQEGRGSKQDSWVMRGGHMATGERSENSNRAVSIGTKTCVVALAWLLAGLVLLLMLWR